MMTFPVDIAQSDRRRTPMRAAGRFVAVLGGLLATGACADRDPLQPDPRIAPPSGGPTLRVTSGTTQVGWIPMSPASTGDWEIGGTGDLTGDGRPDIVWQNRVTRETGVWVMNGTTNVGWVPMPPAETSDWRIGAVAEMTGDGKPDLLWYNRATRQTGVWVMNGTTPTGWIPTTPIESGDWEMGGAGDLTGDGKADIVWHNRVTRHVGVWVMNGTAYVGWVPVGPAESADWEIGAVVDLTGDGKPDIAWQNRVTLQTGTWVMNGTAAAGWVAMAPAASGAWELRAAADLTGDGSPDLVWQNRSSRETGTWVMGGRSSAPPEARHKISYTAFRKAPYGFLGATPWLAVVHAGQSGVASRLEIDHIQLWAEIDGVSRVVAENTYDNGKFGGELRDRTPWFKGIREDMPGTVSAGVLTIRPGDRPEKVWHPYLESHPADRVDISAATRVWFVTRVRLHGPVGVQAGLDYWQKLGYGDNRNEEANATDWEYRQGEWITLRIEPSTEVPSPIELSPPSANGTYPVGQPITGAFFLRNSDDDPIRLDEMGIETRHLDDPYCDPLRSTKGIHSFGWTGTLNLAPGSLTHHSAQWTPAAAGDYCIRVVERRSGVPGYQQPYASSPFITVRVR